MNKVLEGVIDELNSVQGGPMGTAGSEGLAREVLRALRDHGDDWSLLDVRLYLLRKLAVWRRHAEDAPNATEISSWTVRCGALSALIISIEQLRPLGSLGFAGGLA